MAGAVGIRSDVVTSAAQSIGIVRKWWLASGLPESSNQTGLNSQRVDASVGNEPCHKQIPGLTRLPYESSSRVPSLASFSERSVGAESRSELTVVRLSYGEHVAGS